MLDVSRCSEIVNDENVVEVICQSSNAREQSVSSENLSTHQIFFQPRWNIFSRSISKSNPVMELYKYWQRKNSASLEIFPVVPSSLFIYIKYCYKIFYSFYYTFFTCSKFLYKVPAWDKCWIKFNVLLKLKTLGLIVRLARKIDVWCRSYIQIETIVTIVCKSGAEATSRCKIIFYLKKKFKILEQRC